ncbi:ankyrin repeat domain-containing protein [Shewanella sp.]|uniref:ankyrin repeat domain-containing protein n=1 Tax=Shewanella sp. TaxID=50422 RepID=UPI003562C2FA
MAANLYRYSLCLSSADGERVKRQIKPLTPSQALEFLGLADWLGNHEYLEDLKAFSNHLRLDIASDGAMNFRLMRAAKAIGVEFIKVQSRCTVLDTTQDSYFFHGRRPQDTELSALLSHFLPEDSLESLVANQDADQLGRLLTQGLNPNTPIGDEPLVFNAILHRSLSVFNLLLRRGADREEKDGQGLDLMSHLLSQGDKKLIPFIQSLLDNGWDPAKTLQDGGSILWHCFSLDYELAGQLHRRGFPYIRPHNIYASGTTEQQIKHAICHHDQPVLERLLSPLVLNHDQLMVLAGICAQVDNLVGFKYLESIGLEFGEHSDDMVELLQGAAAGGSFRLVAYLLLKSESLALNIDDCCADLIEYLVADDRASRLISIITRRIQHFDHNRAIGTAIHHNALNNLSILLKANKPFRYRTPLLHDYLEELSPMAAHMLLAAGENPAETNFDGETVFEAMLRLRPGDEALHRVFQSALFELPVSEHIWLLIALGDTHAFQQSWHRLREKQILNHQGDSLLIHACRHGATDIVHFLLDKEVRLSHTNHDSNTALGIAVLYGFTDICRLLLEAGANPRDQLKVPSQKTTGSQRSLDVLLGPLSRLRQEAEALREPLRPGGIQPLLNWVGHLGDLVLAQLLVCHGARLNSRDTDGATALYFAVANGHLALSEYLLSQGADAHSWFNGASLLHTACYRGQGALLPVLLSAGLSLDTIDDKGDTPLHHAARMGAMHQEDLCTQLIDAGSELNAQNQDGQTPLMTALLMLNHSGASSLLTRGADACVLDKSGTSAYDHYKALGIPSPELPSERLKPSGIWFHLHKLSHGLGRLSLWYLLPGCLATTLIWQLRPAWLPYTIAAIIIWWSISLLLGLRQKAQQDAARPQLLSSLGHLGRDEDEIRFMASWDDNRQDLPLSPPRLQA